MTIDDLKIPGAKLPAIKGSLMSRIVNWDGPDQMINYGVGNIRYSFGTIMRNGVQYILAEEKNYALSLHYMIPTTTIEELAIEQGMISKKKTEKVMKKHEITRIELKKIHDVACSTWKITIKDYAKRNPFGDMIEFTQEEVDKMFSASDVGQLKVLTSIFGEPLKELNFKSDSIDCKVDGIDVFSATNIRLIDAFITLPDSDLNYFHLNPDYLWEIKYNSLIVTRK